MPCARRPLPTASRPDRAAVDAVVAALVSATRPLIVAGGGSRAAAAELRALAGLGIPVLTTVNGKGVLDEAHPAALGAGARLTAAHDAVNEADVLIVVGSELGDSDLWGGTVAPGRPGERTVVRIDVDPGQAHKNVRADHAIVADARLALRDLVDGLRDKGIPGWDLARATTLRGQIDAEAAQSGAAWEPIQRSLAAALPADSVVAGDSSQVTYYGTVHTWPFTPANRLLYPTGYATLGYGLPAAIGAKVAAPDRSVVALFGDGAAMFSIQELITATEQGLAIPVVIVDNGGYAEIREQMVDRGIQPQAVDLYRPDIPALARAIGAHGVAATSVDELGPLAAQALSADRPTVIYYHV
nr:thiamine pyrophosphate-dependent enzyme [Pedococcus badiiscoriae]